MDRTSPRERRQNAILDAAEALFLEQGYERTSLAEIVKRSGGSLATLYELFGNKQGLLHAIAHRWSDETMFRSLDDEATKGLSNVEILKSYAHCQSEMMESPRAVALMRMLISESLRDRGFAQQIYHDLHVPALEELTELFRRWVAAGEAEIDNPEAAARLFFDIVVGDSMLNTLAGIEDEWLDSDQIDWRLQPFLTHFRIR
ncbi:MAG: TetR/AcrR family transcriptional regulator [Sphingopyxis sp.]|nr:TetR/AcrR family transcriptional regulator [Sphingopyxis sp.]